MPQTVPPGLGEIDALVHACYTRTNRKRDRPLPIVVLLGTPGSGKTHALTHFARATRFAPSARLDFAGGGQRRPYEVAVQIAFHLARKYRDLNRLRFPRLLIGLVALGSTLSDANPQQAQYQLRQALRAHRRRRIDPEQAAAWVATGTSAFGLPAFPAIEQVITLLVKAFEYTPVNSILNRNLGWYAERNPWSATSAEDELIELNRRSHSVTAADTDFVDHRLCEAFLADLRAAYAHSPTGQNALALLDNIDHPDAGDTGTAFLELLARLRTAHAAALPSGHDPLLIVATSATTHAIPGPSDGRPDDPYIRRAADASYDDWLPRPEVPPVNWWYPVRLRDLSEAEVARIGAAHEEETAARTQRPVVRNLRATAPLVHRLSYGHPWSVRQLHLAMGELLAAGAPDQDPEHELHTILAAPVVDPAGHTDPEHGPRLSTFARAHLLSGLTEDQRAAAVRLSAARTPSAAVNAGLLTGLTEQARDNVMVELRHRLWLFTAVPEDANTRGGIGPSGYLGAPPDEKPVLHPWLRLLLLEELADPTGGDGLDWRQAHDDLRAWHERHNRRLDALYHRLAADELEAVVDEFTLSFARAETAADAVNWLRDLYYVTAAPMHRAQLTDGRPSHNASALARRHAPLAYTDHELGRPLAELAAALWLAGDPRNRLPPGRPELNYRISAMFRQLAMSVNADADTLLDEAARYPN